MSEVELSEHCVRSRVCRQWRDVFQHAAVLRVRNVEVARTVDRNSGRIAQVVGGGADAAGVAIARPRRETPALSEHQAGSSAHAWEGVAAGDKWIRLLEHAAVTRVRHVEIARCVHRRCRRVA
jgi:hypothetical protein